MMEVASVTTPKGLADWIVTYDDAFPADLCTQLRALVDLQPDAVFAENWRRCQGFTRIDSRPILYDDLCTRLRTCFVAYKESMACAPLHHIGVIEAPNVFRYKTVDPAGANLFSCHTDAWSMETASRQVSIIVYLNDVDAGGETRFPKLDMTVKAKAGRVLLFPSSALFEHEGRAPLSHDKYILVTWLHLRGQGHHYRCHPFC